MKLCDVRELLDHQLIFLQRFFLGPNFGANIGSQHGCPLVCRLNFQDLLAGENCLLIHVAPTLQIRLSHQHWNLSWVRFELLVEVSQCAVIIGFMSEAQGLEINALRLTFCKTEQGLPMLLIV